MEGGACVVGGMVGGGCVAGGMCGGGMCVGCVWQGACMARGHVWQGAWWGGMHGRYYEIWSMSGRYCILLESILVI